jgi:hypothetical protein
MGKAKRDVKKERKRNKELDEAERLDALRRTKRNRLLLALVPLVFGGGAAVAAFSFERRSLAGAILLAGAMVWLMVALGFVGGQVKPKDRDRAGSIDFGNRR